MVSRKPTKRRLVTSFNNLSAELQEAVKAAYPLGFTESMMRIEKPNGDFFYAVSFATDETDYLVKIDVKVDGKNQDDDKDIFGDNIKGEDDEFQADNEEEDEHRGKRNSITGAYDDNDDDM